MMNITKKLIEAFEARIQWQEQPTTVLKTRNGWAAYKGDVRITRFFFSEDGAREAGIAWEASDIKVQF